VVVKTPLNFTGISKMSIYLRDNMLLKKLWPINRRFRDFPRKMLGAFFWVGTFAFMLT
jgi:hypothetical protein